MNRIVIRREDKNRWERRVPFVPDDIVELVAAGHTIHIQRSPSRAFVDAAYEAAGAHMVDDTSQADLILGVREVEPDHFKAPTAWMFFSHTHKGQPRNMPMLQGLLDSRGTLIDYELIVDDAGQRLVFFGEHAGLAGAIEALVALGKRWQLEGITTPLARLEQPYRYTDLSEALAVLENIGAEIEEEGLPADLPPLRIAVLGYGNVGRGVRKILDALPTRWYEPQRYLNLDDDCDRHFVHATVLRERHMVEPIDDRDFQLDDYYDHPENYRPVVNRYLAVSTIVATAYYWDHRYPRFITNRDLRQLAEAGDLQLEVIADINCDIDGSVEATTRSTDPGEPTFNYDPITGEYRDGLRADGIDIMAVDTLSAELSVDASRHFGQALRPFVPALMNADFEASSIAGSGLPDILQRACIAWRGELRPPFSDLETQLDKYGRSE